MKLRVVSFQNGSLDPLTLFNAQDIDTEAGREALTEQIFMALDADCDSVTVRPSS